MNSPYYKRFRVSQIYHSNHAGLDLVGVDSKEIHSTINGKVIFAGWENEANKKQGFGLYVVIRDDKTGYYFYFGHLSELKVKTGDNVKITGVIGIEGSTGNSTGSHCHYEVRTMRGAQYKFTANVSKISGIPNVIGTYDDGYRISVNFTTGNYKILVNKLNVREGAGTNYRIKEFSEYSKNAQRLGGYVKNVIFTALKIEEENRKYLGKNSKRICSVKI